MKRPIARGYIPEGIDEDYGFEPTAGWLRIGPETEIVDRLPSDQFTGTYRRASIEVDVAWESGADWVRRSVNSWGEHGVRFTGRLSMGDEVYDAQGVHFRSGFYVGEVDLMPLPHSEPGL